MYQWRLPEMALLAAVFLSAACGSSTRTPSSTSESTVEPAIVGTIAAQRVALDSHNGTCRVTSAAGHVELAIPWPCDFHRTPDGDIRTMRRGQATLALVETSRPHPEIPGSCKTQLQALGISGRDIFVSTSTDTVAQCLPFQWDEQMFRGLFGDKEPGAAY